MKTKKLFLVFLTAVSLGFLTNCRKNITVPDPELSNIFGTWDWVQSFGGLTGKAITPATEGHSSTVEFTKKGLCFFVTGKHKDKMEFTLSVGHSIYSTSEVSLISYKDIGAFDMKNAPITQSIHFQGIDTLFLSDECGDCFTHMYIRKK